MEWSEPAIVLSVAAFGESDLRTIVLAETHGAWHGLARGGAGRRGAAIWQEGNLINARWVARLPEQLGSISGELVHPAAAIAMADPLALAVLRAACAVAAGALPEREAHRGAFIRLARLLGGIGIAGTALPALVRFELELLRELGYGLDLSSCALSGAAEDLAFVSPRTGRAVARGAAGDWAPRLLKLPAFLLDEDAADDEADLAACRDGLALTGHFLARDAFGARHAPLPTARLDLYDRLTRRLNGDDDAR
ncbi:MULTISPECIES: DNA repair protein RecO [unclassified Acidiphilium]|jgi:DNA repair protein RecO (recombination protein O)|uniref:DNA repair protein RecO n=1 Tax=unclassified Acidiphilium TaxID=2617493 RepID=UPI0004618B48|nr:MULTISPECIES: DNA repair protein RecO [unclassified Acidiphilium]KDM66806.1 DNA repair protein RecO [Acidiphilium sp. JA12-A1]